MKKKDIILIAILFVLALCCYFFFGTGETGEQVVISVDGEEYKTLPLLQNNIITVELGQNRNVIKIEDGKVSMEEASCPDQLCKKQGIITHAKEMIVCLPNRVVVEIKGAKQAGAPDAIVQ